LRLVLWRFTVSTTCYTLYPDVGPQVIVADDDGMEVDGPAAAAPPLHEDVEDEELEPVSDEDGEAIFDADSDDEPGV